MVASLVAVLVLQLPAAPPAAGAHIDSLLAAGDVPRALRAAERLVARQPRDPGAHLVLGRAHFARRVIGRYPALEAFRTAARLAPHDPEPLYWQMKVGFYLGSDEGDVMAREALLRLFALTPDYADAWERFQQLYGNPRIWRRAERALAAHGDDPVALERRAALHIALEDGPTADSLLAIVVAQRPAGARTALLRAEAAFLSGRDSVGYAWHDTALAHANRDAAGALWRAVWMIASPDEIGAYDGTPPAERSRFFSRFWATRDPNLVTRENERVAEHFRRVAYARRYFRLLHPLNLFHRSARYRAVIMQGQGDYLANLFAALANHVAAPAGLDTRLASERQLPGVRDAAPTTTSALAGADARGLVYIRHGAPAQRLLGIFDPLNQDLQDDALDVEGWLYHTPAGTFTIGFRRATGSGAGAMASGDFIFLPTSRRQARSTAVALTTDHTSLPAPLEVRGWSAFFKSGELGLTDAYYKAQGGTTAVVLWDDAGGPRRARGAGLLQVSVPPGRYALGLDVDSAGVLGRVRRSVDVPAFPADELRLSSLVVTRGPVPPDRAAALEAMPADLGYAIGDTLGVFAEVYGLASDDAGRAQYRVQYRFEAARPLPARLLGRARPVLFEFERDVSGDGSVVERLVIEPGRLAAGRYRMSVALSDLRRNVKSQVAVLNITIR